MTTTTTTTDASARERGDPIEQLLAEIQASAGSAVWQRVETLVTALIGLYGEDLARILAHAPEAAKSREDLDAQLASDDRLSSLLLVHDLHPLGLEERVKLALLRLRDEMPGAAGLELVEVTDNIVRLGRVKPRDAPIPSVHVVTRAIEHDAPDVSGVQIDGLPSPPPSELVPVERLRVGGHRRRRSACSIGSCAGRIARPRRRSRPAASSVRSRSARCTGTWSISSTGGCSALATHARRSSAITAARATAQCRSACASIRAGRCRAASSMR
jgi:hypothetical protein